MPAYLENIIAFRVENHDALVEMVVLHCACCVEDRKGTVRFQLESIVGSSVVEIMAELHY